MKLLTKEVIVEKGKVIEVTTWENRVELHEDHITQEIDQLTREKTRIEAELATKQASKATVLSKKDEVRDSGGVKL